MIFKESQEDFYTDTPDEAPQSVETQQSDSRHISFATPADLSSASDTGNGEPEPHRRKMRRILIWLGVAVVAVLAVVAYFRYFNPYVSDAQMSCYVIGVEKRGIIFKTYEADVVSQQSMTDTVRVYSREHSFSIGSPELAQSLRRWQGTGREVTVTYKTYWASLPWRGASKSVITAVNP